MQTISDVLDANKSRILRMLRQKLGSEEAAQDVYQMVSEQLLRTDVVTELRNPEAYVYRAASNMAVSYHRAARARRHYEDRAALDASSEASIGPEHAVQAEEAVRVLEDALNELPILTKRMFLSSRLDGLRQQDVARKYRVSLSTVEKHIARASLHCHRRLRESTQLRPQYVGSGGSNVHEIRKKK